MVLKITNLHILRYLPTCWLYLLERYTIDNQRYTHTASVNDKQLKTSYNKYQQAVKAQLHGIADIPFFLYRVCTIFG